MTSSNRASRRETTSAEIQNLYLRSATRNKSADAAASPTSGTIPEEGALNRKPAVTDARSLGVALTREGLIARPRALPGKQGTRNFVGRRNDRGIKVGRADARSLGAIPGGEAMPGRFSMGRFAREGITNLSAAPSGGPEIGRSLRNRITDQATRAPLARRTETVGLPEKQRFPTSRPRPDFLADRQQPMRRTRAENGIQERAQQSRNSFASRKPQGEGGRKKPGPKGFRKKRDGGGARSGGDRGPPVAVWNAEEKEYFEAKAESEAAKIEVFQPRLSSANLNGVTPAVPSSLRGMSITLTDRLALARKHINNEYIQWESREQKADVVILAQQLKAGRQPKGAEQKSTTISETQMNTDSLIQKICGGKYELVRPGEKDVIGNVARHTDRNETYSAEDEKSLLEKIKSLLPAEKASRAGKSLKA